MPGKKIKSKCGRFTLKLKSRGDSSASTTRKAPKPTQQFFDEEWLRKRWGSSISLVRKLRYSGQGPTVTYIGRAVRYQLHDVKIYERAQKFKSASDRDTRGPKPR